MFKTTEAGGFQLSSWMASISYLFTERYKFITRKLIASIISAGKINLISNILSRLLDIFKLSYAKLASY